jgi:hypothetical protein
MRIRKWRLRDAGGTNTDVAGSENATSVGRPRSRGLSKRVSGPLGTGGRLQPAIQTTA